MNCPYPFKIKRENVSAQHYLMNGGLVPCGSCAICRQAKINDWAFRLRWEMKDPKTISTAFLTLTYDDKYLSHVNEQTGEITKMPNLVKSDITKFLKNLRRQQSYHYIKGAKIRYFCIGEYGTRFQRPHYHLIIFNLHPELLKIDYQHGKMRVNRHLHKIWKKGFIDVGTLTEGSLMYVVQFHSLPSDRFEASGRHPEFSRMSTKPPLGQWYVTANQETHLKSGKYFVNNHQFKQRIPRTLKNKIFSHECPLIDNLYKQKLLDAQSNAAKHGKEEYLKELNSLAEKTENHYNTKLTLPEEIYENRLISKEKAIRKRRNSKGKF